MIKYINVGKIVNTHALKGEVRIISDFEFKDRVFIPNNVLYIGQFKDREVIETYHPERVIIEPSGVGKLSDIIKAIGTVEEELEIVENKEE